LDDAERDAMVESTPIVEYLIGRRWRDWHMYIDPLGLPATDFDQRAKLYPEQRARAAEIKKLVDTLEAMDKTKLLIMYNDERSREHHDRITRAEIDEQHRFFNSPVSLADFNHWATFPYWTSEEATALSLGRDPSRVNFDTMKSYLEELPSRASSPFARQYRDRRNLIYRTHGEGSKILPGELVQWGVGLSLELAPGLLEAVSLCPEPPNAIHPKARNSLLKIIIGIAIAKYRYDPKRPMNTAPRRMAEDVCRVGYPITDDTIRTYLAEAREIPPQLADNEHDSG
jgi:hypothetical protein